LLIHRETIALANILLLKTNAVPFIISAVPTKKIIELIFKKLEKSQKITEIYQILQKRKNEAFCIKEENFFHENANKSTEQGCRFSPKGTYLL